MIRIDVDALIEPADHHIERPFEIGQDTQFLAENLVGHVGIGLELRIARFVEVAVGEILPRRVARSEEHTSELQSLMRISYAVFCLKKKKNINIHLNINYYHHYTLLIYTQP